MTWISDTPELHLFKSLKLFVDNGNEIITQLNCLLFVKTNV